MLKVFRVMSIIYWNKLKQCDLFEAFCSLVGLVLRFKQVFYYLKGCVFFCEGKQAYATFDNDIGYFNQSVNK